MRATDEGRAAAEDSVASLRDEPLAWPSINTILLRSFSQFGLEPFHQDLELSRHGRHGVGQRQVHAGTGHVAIQCCSPYGDNSTPSGQRKVRRAFI
jgi:hypothetical protein